MLCLTTSTALKRGSDLTQSAIGGGRTSLVPNDPMIWNGPSYCDEPSVKMSSWDDRIIVGVIEASHLLIPFPQNPTRILRAPFHSILVRKLSFQLVNNGKMRESAFQSKPWQRNAQNIGQQQGRDRGVEEHTGIAALE